MIKHDYQIIVVKNLKYQKVRYMSILQDKYILGDKICKNIIKAEDKVTKKPSIIKKVSFSSISPKKKEHIVN